MCDTTAGAEVVVVVGGVDVVVVLVVVLVLDVVVGCVVEVGGVEGVVTVILSEAGVERNDMTPATPTTVPTRMRGARRSIRRRNFRSGCSRVGREVGTIAFGYQS